MHQSPAAFAAATPFGESSMAIASRLEIPSASVARDIEIRGRLYRSHILFRRQPVEILAQFQPLEVVLYPRSRGAGCNAHA